MDLLINRFYSKCLALLFGMLVFFSVAACCQTSGSGEGTTPSRQDIEHYLQQHPNADPSQNPDVQNNSNQTNVPADMNQGTGTATVNKDSIPQNNGEKEPGPDDTYGAYVFGNAAVASLSELSIPPLDYPIGVGDHIVVALWGGGESQQTYIVARDGSIFPQGLGKIIVQGLTFEQARELIYSKFKRIVPSTTNISVTLGAPRSITVNVGGEVRKPGPLTVSAFSNAFNVIGLAGGITPLGNLRAIQVKRDGKIIQVLDVYKYLSTGEIGDHVYLQNNDFILVTFVEKKVKATGFFKRPMYYQLKKDEGVQALMQYAGGFSSNAFTSSIKVLRNENEKQVIHNVNATAMLKDPGNDYALSDGDIVEIDSIKTGIANKVEVAGAVTYPGVYEFKQGDHLFDLIHRAGGVLKNTFLHRVLVFRGGADSTGLTANMERLDVDISGIDAANSSADTNNVLIQPNDLIQLFRVNEFADAEYVDIYGEVRKPGHLPKYAGMTLQDLLYLSGGIKPDAQYGRLEISSVVDVDSARSGYKPTRTIVRSYAITPDLQVDTIASKIILQPYDQIYVRINPVFRTQQNVQLLGLFKYPGFYPRLSTSEKLSDYVTRAGGFAENADLSGAILYRQKIDLFRESIVKKSKVDTTGSAAADSTEASLREPVSIDLQEALKDNNNKQNIVLEENDIIYVPEVNPFVTVAGSVQSPLKITYDDAHKHIGYYIDEAGGFGIHPWRRRIYITYANGKSRRTNNFAFFHFYPKVTEGSTITVPHRPEGKAFTDALTQSLTTIIPVILGGILIKLI